MCNLVFVRVKIGIIRLWRSYYYYDNDLFLVALKMTS